MRIGNVFILLWVLAPPSAYCQKQLWSVDLTKNKDFAKRSSVSSALLAPAAVSFLNGSQVLLSFYDDESTNFDPELERNRFHVLEVDARNGTFGRELDFPAADDRAQVRPVADGGFVVQAGAALTKFGKDFISAERYPTPLGGTHDHWNFWLMDVTPDQSQVVLYHREAANENVELIRLANTDLSLIRSEPVKAQIVWTALSASDSDYVRNSYPAKCKCAAQFISNDLVIVMDNDGHYSVEPVSKLGSSGAVADGSFTRVGVSAKSTRLVFASAIGKGCRGLLVKSDCSEIAGRIIVMDWKSRKRVAEIEINEPVRPPGPRFAPSMALSPDGRQLLVFLHQTLTAYSLPD